MLPEQRGEGAPVLRGQRVGPVVFGEDVLQHEGVYDQDSLQDPQAQHGHFLLVLAVGGDLAAFAAVDNRVRAVEGLDDVEAFGDLALQLAAAQEPGDEDRALCAADLQHCLVGGVGRGAGEAAQDRLGRSGALTDRGGVLDHLVVVLLDQVPADRAGQRRGQERVGVGLPSDQTVQADLVDLLDPGEQVEPQQSGDAEADLGLYVDESSGSSIPGVSPRWTKAITGTCSGFCWRLLSLIRRPGLGAGFPRTGLRQPRHHRRLRPGYVLSAGHDRRAARTAGLAGLRRVRFHRA